jgi:hypothetical protein
VRGGGLGVAQGRHCPDENLRASAIPVFADIEERMKTNISTILPGFCPENLFSNQKLTVSHAAFPGRNKLPDLKK